MSYVMSRALRAAAAGNRGRQAPRPAKRPGAPLSFTEAMDRDKRKAWTAATFGTGTPRAQPLPRATVTAAAPQPAPAAPEVVTEPEAPAVTETPVRPEAAVAVRTGMTALAGPPPRPDVEQVPAEPYRGDGIEITGADWLNYMRMFFARYVIWPSEAALDTAVLWAAHTYARESMDNGAGLIWKATPRLFMLSKERNSGKSTVLNLLLKVCPRTGGLDTEPTEYGLLDSLLEDRPTLLIDELGILIDSDKRKRGVQQILLNGYTPVGTKLREKGGKRQRVPLFAPIALAGLDVVQDNPSENIKAILSRGPIFIMKPSADGNPPAGDMDEEEDYVDEVVHRIRLAGMGWTITNREWLRNANPEPAEGAVRRWRQIWRPMLAIADGAGEDWPERAREACVKLRHGYAAADDEEREALTEVKGAVDDMKRAMAGMFG